MDGRRKHVTNHAITYIKVDRLGDLGHVERSAHRVPVSKQRAIFELVIGLLSPCKFYNRYLSRKMS